MVTKFVSWGHSHLSPISGYSVRWLMVLHSSTLTLWSVMWRWVLRQSPVVRYWWWKTPLVLDPLSLRMNVICWCYQDLFGAHSLPLFDLPSVKAGPQLSSWPGSIATSLPLRIQEIPWVLSGFWHTWAMCISGGVMKLVASTFPEQLSRSGHALWAPGFIFSNRTRCVFNSIMPQAHFSIQCRDYLGQSLLLYLDDIIVMNSSLTQHQQRLEVVLGGSMRRAWKQN